jgi:hypothetical protein
LTYHNVRVKNRRFKFENLVLRKLKAMSNIASKGKLGLKWDGSFKVAWVVKANTYQLKDMEGKSLPHA